MTGSSNLSERKTRRSLPFSFYGTLNTLLICTFVLLSITSHARAAYSDPGFVPLPKKAIDFSDVKFNEADTNHSKVGQRALPMDETCLSFE